MRTATLLLASLVALVCGCALTSKGDAVQPRFFGIENFAKEPPVSGSAKRSLRLGRIDAGAHLRERIVFREPSGELGFYEERRWSEQPENYVRRALTHALYEHAQLQQVLHGAAPTLDLEILAFDEVRFTDRPPVARVQVAAALHDDRVVVWHDTVTIEKPIRAQAGPAAPDPNATVRAMTEALHELAHRIATQVAGELQKLPPESEAPPS